MQGVQALLHGEMELVVMGPQVLGHTPGCKEVWCALNANAEGVQPLVCAVCVLSLFQMPAAAC